MKIENFQSQVCVSAASTNLTCAKGRAEMGLNMRYLWLDEYLLGKAGATKDLQKDWNWIRYHIGGKMFAAVCLGENDEPYYITLKLEPAEGDFLRKQYEDIVPGYYCNKQHWNSIKPDGSVPDELLKELLDKSYFLVLAGFPKKKQRELLGLSVCGTDCTKCTLLGSACKGCNESDGKVFHAPDGKPCPIYGCCANKHRYAVCGYCDDMACDIWKMTRDPSMTDSQFEASIQERINNLKGVCSYGVRL